MKRTREAVAGMALGLALGMAADGCSGPPQPMNGDGGEGDLSGGGGGDLAMEGGDMRVDPGNAVDLTGSWASKLVNSQAFSGPLGDATVAITTLARVQLKQEGKVVTTTTEVCSVKLSPYKTSQTTYPDKAIAAIAADNGMADLSIAAAGGSYTPKRRVQLLGWVANDPVNEVLPKDPKDPRVRDADMDGKPGVTLMVDAGLIKGSVYVVNRSIIDIKATITSKDRVAGSSHTEQQQIVLDSDNPLLKGMVMTKPDPDASASTFLLVRTGPADDSCSAIKSGADRIFK